MNVLEASMIAAKNSCKKTIKVTEQSSRRYILIMLSEKIMGSTVKRSKAKRDREAMLVTLEPELQEALKA